MNTTPSPDTRYWLLPGETPFGPYTTAEILSQIQAGTCSWITRASQVGSTEWLPLNQLLTLAPVANRVDDTVPVSIASSPLGNKPTKTFQLPFTGNLLAIFIGVLVLGLVGYWLYSSYFAESPLSPRQICQSFSLANSAAEAKPFVTSNMYMALTVLFDQPNRNEDEFFELSSEQPAPPQVGGGYYVGFRAHLRDATTSIMLSGVYHVVNQSGWKINDIILIGANQQTIQPPISMAREYEFFRNPDHPSVATRQASEAKQQAQQWYQTQPVNNSLKVAAASALAKSGAGKWIASVIGVICVGAFGMFRRRQAVQSKRK